MKTKLWQYVGSEVVRNYDYVWFMDDDMLFSKDVFPYDQFLQVVRKADAVISSPKIIRDTGKTKKHKGTVIGETLSSKFFEKVDMIEEDSVMFKQEAWIFFHDNILMDTPNSDYGADCVWCPIFTIEHFGKVPCLRALHYGLIHTNGRTLAIPNVHYGKDGAHNRAKDLYGKKIKSMYNDTIKMICDPNRLTVETFPISQQYHNMHN